MYNPYKTFESDFIKHVEMECLVCGDHQDCNPDKINICYGCHNGVMKIVGE